MIEVEAKVRISNPSQYRKKIRSISRLIGKSKKVDDYYSLENPVHYPKRSLRIRKINHTHEINFKQKLSYAKGVHAKIESEFEVSDIKNFIGLIEEFGFKKWLRKEKHSEVYRINKNFNIELNKVKNLGWFLEIEYLIANKKDIGKARKEIQKVMKKLSIEKRKIIKDGYTKMLWSKH